MILPSILITPKTQLQPLMLEISFRTVTPGMKCDFHTEKSTYHPNDLCNEQVNNGTKKKAPSCLLDKQSKQENILKG